MGVCFSSASVGQKLSSPSTKSKSRVDDVDKPTSVDVDANCGMPSAKFRTLGSKDDIFVDSQPSLESDAEDEFFSVNGDLTPSRTPYSSSIPNPMHRNLSVASSDFNEDKVVGCKLSQTSSKRLKNLSELFRESNIGLSNSKKETDEDKKERSSNGIVKVKNERSRKSASCLRTLFVVLEPKH
ncbi:hypothetical protein QQ045_006706 [Rhodiola kirilowii]